jgi:uncharacterized protein YjbI with pentapeptide repeats
MAIDKQVRVLRSGVEKWNAWRKGNLGIEIDLRRANLNGANLRGANLSTADLGGATLDFASLVETRLDRAILVDCTVYGVSTWN